ncbi:DNA polymerase [Ralstonia phage phiAp1]|uniref:DNA polymerase n=1 Tax=Ralstonia phage phiAp1 TaxID=2783867 RepID=A0A1L7DS61_9CAUD|nr:DNA polymerase [Ralstonia phage phiAp1]APU03166.1 DNA polymerase [Ralstonia phage phiAp1]
MSRIMFFDLETENHPWFGAVASPRCPDNYVVLNGWAVDDGPIEYLRNESKEEAASRPWLTIPDDVTMLVAHNAPFEMDWALTQQRQELHKFLKRGGRVFCTAYAHYLLTNQRETYPSLNDIAPEYGGEHKVDGVKLLWEQGFRTSQIDPALLLEYLISPTQGDVANTRRIFYEQVRQLQARGMWEMALDRMEGMLFACFAMDSGLMVDRKLAFEQRDAGEARLKELSLGFQAYRSEFPADVIFKETSDFHMSAWLYGGPIKYRHRVPKFNDDGSPVWEKGDAVTLTSPVEMVVFLNEQGQMPVQIGDEIVYKEPEVAGFDHGFQFARYKSGKNKGLIKVTREDTSIQKRVWEDTTYLCKGVIDLKALPESVREDFLDEHTGKRKLADESLVISSGKDALDFLKARKEFPEHVQKIIKDLHEFNKVDKDMGTYYLRQEFDDDGNVTKQSGMLQFLDDLDIVHHSLNMTSTVTTRLSSNKPNFQNIPRGDTSDVKKIFVSRFNSPKWLIWALENKHIDQTLFDVCMAEILQAQQEGRWAKNGYIVELDYTALEVVTLAAFSQDKALIKALLDGTDMHCLRLSKKLKEAYEDVLKKCKDEAHPDHARYHVMRTEIKPPSFAYQYGATARGISYSTGMPIEEAEKFIADEKELFPGVEAFYDEQIIPTVERSTQNFREQSDAGDWRVYGRGVWQSPGGTCYEFRQWPKMITSWEGGRRIRMEVMQYKPTQMRNYPIQGESGFFVQGISGLVIRWLIANDFFGGRVWVINTVHDAIYLDVHHSVLDIVCKYVKQIMESLPQYFSQKYGYNLNVPFPAAAEYGPNMHTKEHWKEAA